MTTTSSSRARNPSPGAWPDLALSWCEAGQHEVWKANNRLYAWTPGPGRTLTVRELRSCESCAVAHAANREASRAALARRAGVRTL